MIFNVMDFAMKKVKQCLLKPQLHNLRLAFQSPKNFAVTLFLKVKIRRREELLIYR